MTGRRSAARRLPRHRLVYTLEAWVAFLLVALIATTAIAQQDQDETLDPPTLEQPDAPPSGDQYGETGLGPDEDAEPPPNGYPPEPLIEPPTEPGSVPDPAIPVASPAVSPA